MATRSEERRVARWMAKHRAELELSGVDTSAMERVIRRHDPEAFRAPGRKGRKRGQISEKAMNKIRAICRRIKQQNGPPNGLLYVAKEGYLNYFYNTPGGFARMMLAIEMNLAPDKVERKALFDIVSNSFAGYNVGSYSTFMYNCNELIDWEGAYIQLAKYISEMDCDI